MSEHYLSEEELIQYVKPYLKAKGFKKKNKRWTKVLDDFTLVFYLQGSCYSKEDYYIRPGVFMNDCPQKERHYYGHFMIEIPPTTPQQILSEVEAFFSEWTDKDLIVQRTKAFVEWEQRNPLEKRRAGEVDYDNDPVPSQVFFRLGATELEYILRKL